MLKMMQDIGNKLEAKMDNLQETLSKEIQDIKLKQEEMQHTITEIKYSLEAANSRIQEAEEWISEVEDRLGEITDGEKKRGKRFKTNEESLSLQEKDFRLSILKMMQGIGNKLEAKMDDLQETLSKEIQDIKLKQQEMQLQ